MTFKISTLCLALLLSAAVLSACQQKVPQNDLGLPDKDKPAEPEVTALVYNHPSALYGAADFAKVKSALASGTAPAAAKAEFENLKKSDFTLASYKADPTKEIVRGDPKGTEAGKENYSNAMRDAAAAYQMALLWQLTGDESYASRAVAVLNAWVNTCVAVTSNDSNKNLAAGAQGCTFALAGEMLRDYGAWSESDFKAFKNWMLTVFAPVNKHFLDTHLNTCDDHYWSNWDLVAMCSYFAIGVLTESDDMVRYIVDYFHKGSGNGCIKKLIQAKHSDPLGTGETIAQNQESGRDQGHSAMSASVTAHLSQMAYTLYLSNPDYKELDFFAADDNAILAMSEYVALCNLKEGNDNSVSDGKWIGTGAWIVPAYKIPFQKYEYCIDCSCSNKTHGATHTAMSEASRGTVRPGWEIVYQHYAKVKKLSSGFIYSKLFAQKIRPEGGVGEPGNRYGYKSGAFDQLGWNTIMMIEE